MATGSEKIPSDPADLVYLRSTDPLVVARRARKILPSGFDEGYLLAYPGQHAVQFQVGSPPILGSPHPVAPLLLDREIMHAGSRIPLLKSVRVCCLGCEEWVPPSKLGTSGMCLSCRPLPQSGCQQCGRQARADQLIRGSCLLCLAVSRLFVGGG